jgi:hypothetical protein
MAGMLLTKAKNKISDFKASERNIAQFLVAALNHGNVTHRSKKIKDGNSQRLQKI